MNIARFRILFPGHPLSSVFAMMQNDEGSLAAAKGMAAGMVILLAHLNQLSADEAIELMDEIGSDVIPAANDPAPGAIH